MMTNCPNCRGTFEVSDAVAGAPAECPHCRQVVVPQVSQPAPGRPTVVTVLGILCIVFGSLALLCMPVSLGFSYRAQGMMGMSPGMRTWTVVSTLLAMGIAGWELAIGIGLLKLKAWARSGALIYGWVVIAWVMIGTVANLGVYSRTFSGPGGWVGLGTLIVSSLLAIVIPILLLIFMRKPAVVAAFR